jgi:putative N6-adenine-specific DNA methylase
LKENIAAAMILLSLWKFNQPFLDPFCGSGTLAIEAALLAKNGAPGKGRVFDFQKFKNFEPNARNLLLEDAKKGEFSKDYQIFARDIDETVLEYAKMNAENAGVQSCIHFEKCDFLSDFSSFTPPLSENLRLVTNPPYGKRLNADENLDPLYQKLALCLKECKG